MMRQKLNIAIAVQVLLFLAFMVTIPGCARTNPKASEQVALCPHNNATGVNPDTHLRLTFHSTPTPGSSGKIRIVRAADGQVIDSLDLSIPPGPTIPDRSKVPYTTVPYEYVPGRFTNANTKAGTPSGTALPTPANYQLTIIGGFTDAFHFYPVIIHDSVAVIYPHNNLLDYDETYYVLIGPGVLTLDDNSFTGITEKGGWTFTTKKSPPPADTRRLVVAADGTGDFSTVQGAVDFIPDNNPDRVTIFIKNGTYEEIVYFRNKTNITFVGEDREKTIICYANNEVFNPHPSNVATNEWPGTFPSRRAAFMADNSRGIHIVNLTVRSINDKPAQAEGLLIMGSENIVYGVSIYGSGDALQVNGSAYFEDTRITGYGDNILGRGPAFFKDCDLISAAGPHMWIRNTEANHGNVFVSCRFSTEGDIETVLARSPINNGRGYPYSEAVLINCLLEGLDPAGWGPVGGETSNVHYWEYNSRDLGDGKPADVSRRHPASRQLTMENDSAVIASYTDPAFVLGGWSPEMAPVITSQPQSVKVRKREQVIFRVEAAALPEASCQWYRDGMALDDATEPVLMIESVRKSDEGAYTVMVSNSAGSVTSDKALLTVK